MPLQATSGAASYDGFGGGVVAEPNYIESCFSTYLYTGNGSTQTITNGIDLSTKGGLVWTKSRNAGYDHELYDTARGINKVLISNSTAASANAPSSLTAFNTTGFTLGANNNSNSTGITGVSWTFRKQPKFFDVVTYTGNGATTRFIPHSLNGDCGAYVVKATSTTGDWWFYHQNATGDLKLNTTAAQSPSGNVNVKGANTTDFLVGANANLTGVSYVCYLWATNAGGFGLTGTDNVISCGSFTTDGSGNGNVTLGYEPQWAMIKSTTNANDWYMMDTMRAWNQSAWTYAPTANTATAEATTSGCYPTATGFNTVGAFPASQTYIYIAIRRGPMKVPTSGTSVFSPTYGLSASNSEFVNAGFPIDLNWRGRTTGDNVILQDRLRGASQLLFSNLTDVESSSSAYTFTTQNGCTFTSTANFSTWINWSFRRAPNFFDEVSYTGTGSARTLSHNLQAVPELILLKDRNNSSGWAWYYGITNKWISMPGGSAPFTSSTIWNDTAPTSSVFSVGANTNSNASGTTYVAYLWASLAGVSKIGTYVGNGSSQTINCGFSAGARFVVITNLTDGGNWSVFDTTRGIVSSYDPVIRLNTAQGEITGEDPVDPASSGFIVNVGGPDYTFVNNSGTTYLYLAIA